MIRRWLFAFVMIAVVVMPLLPAVKAEAAPFARPEHKGYFYNDNDNMGGFVIRAGVHTNTTASFIAYIENTLNSSNEQDQTGAEFIILTMLGYPAGTTKGTAHSAATIQKWEDYVNYYKSKGWINFHANVSYTQNTYWQGKNGGGTNPDDDAWFSDSGSTGSDGAILFKDPGGGGTYAIRKECANPVGAMESLTPPPPADFDVTLIADTNGSAVGAGNPVVPDQPYRLGVEVKNAGPANSSVGEIQVMMPAAGVVQACAPNCNDTGQNALLYGPTGPGGHSFRTNSTIPGPPATADNWHWSVNPLGANGTAGSILNWKVSPTAKVGDVIKFDVYYYKSNLAGAVEHKTVSFTVVSQRTPGFSGANGDIHAGGGTCDVSSGSGNITTHPDGTSYGEYVVSAAGSIANLFSNKATTATNDKLKAANYKQVCRADLLTAAATGWPSGPGIHSIGGTTNGTFYMTGTEEGVYYFNGTHLSVHGAVGAPIAPGTPPKPVTVVALNAAVVVEIDGNIILNNTLYDAHKVPSLGIISAGNIVIDPAATQVDAYLFSSNGMIDTCNAAPSACASNLRVNGFLMAKTLSFGRTGVNPPAGALALSSPIVEQVVLNPQIYLNPPKYFDASVDDILLEGQGERPPLF